MNIRRTLILVAVALALAVYVRRSEPGPGRVAGVAGAGRFPPVAADRLTLIEWARGQTAVRVERGADGHWRMTSPVAAQADAAAIQSFLEQAARLRPRTWLSPAETAGPALKAFGLDETAGVLRLAGPDGQVLLRLGGLAPMSSQFYMARVGAEGVFVADSALLDTLPATANDWRDRSLFPAREGRVDRLILRGSTALEAEQDAVTGQWRLVKPLAARADAAQLVGLIGALVRTQIERFVSDSPPPDMEALGLQPPRAEVVLASGSNVIARLAFGRAATNGTGLVYLWRPDVTNLSLVSAAVLGPLNAPLAAFRDRRLFPPVDGVTRIDLNAGGAASALALEGTNWVVAGPPPLPADPAQIRFFQQQLGALRVNDFPNDVVADYARYGLDRPVGSIRLGWGTNAAVEVQFGRREGVDVVYARRLDEPGVYALRTADAAGLPAFADQLRDLRFATNQVARVWARHGAARRTLEPTADGAWRVTEGASGAPFGPAMAETLHELGALDTTRWPAQPESLYTNLRTFREIDYEAGVELLPGAPVRKLRFRFVTDGAESVIALLNVDDSPVAWRVELPGATLQNIRRDFGAP